MLSPGPQLCARRQQTNTCLSLQLCGPFLSVSLLFNIYWVRQLHPFISCLQSSALPGAPSLFQLLLPHPHPFSYHPAHRLSPLRMLEQIKNSPPWPPPDFLGSSSKTQVEGKRWKRGGIPGRHSTRWVHWRERCGTREQTPDITFALARVGAAVTLRGPGTQTEGEASQCFDLFSFSMCPR